MQTELLDFLRQYVDRDLGASRWFLVDQTMISAFGDLTHDPDPYHQDPAWAEINSPFGGTIAYGFLTLSLLSAMYKDAMHEFAQEAPEVFRHFNGMPINAGFDRLRFLEPVSAGARIRGRFKLNGVESRGERSLRLTVGAEIEIENGRSPALIADWLFLLTVASNGWRGSKIVPTEELPPNQHWHVSMTPTHNNGVDAGMIEYIAHNDTPPPGGHYSQAARYGKLLFISGQLPVDVAARCHSDAAADSFRVQAERAMTNLLQVLAGAGGTPANLAKVTAYIVGIEHWPMFNEVYAEIMGDTRPARAIVPVPALHFGYLVEIDAIAAGLPSD